MQDSKFKRISAPGKQGGWTMWSAVISVCLVVLFLYIGMRLVPIYMDDEVVKSAMQRSLSGIDVGRVNRAGVITGLKKQLYIDGKDSIIDYKKDLNLSRAGGVFVMQINYQREVPLFLNLSLVAKFDHTVEKPF